MYNKTETFECLLFVNHHENFTEVSKLIPWTLKWIKSLPPHLLNYLPSEEWFPEAPAEM